MSGIEPNWLSLLWFAPLCMVGCHGALTLAGLLPLAARPAAATGPVANLLMAGNAALILLSAAATGLYGFERLRWTTLILLVGLVILFTPPLHAVVARAWRDPKKDLAALACLQGGLLAAFLLLHGSARM